MKAAKPVRVCFVIDRLGRAGTETQLIALLRNLDRNRVQPSLCLLNSDDADSHCLQPDDYPTIELGLRKLASPAAVSAASRLASFWRRNRVEVVQTYFIDSAYFAAPLARLCGIRKVVRVRNNVGYWLTPRHRWLGRACACLGLTLTNSEAARRALLDSEKVAEHRVAVIENGVDFDRFPTMALPNTGRSDVRIGAVANLRPVKNIDGLIRVALAICRDRPGVRFEVAGDGDERATLRAQIHSAGLDEQFILHGAVGDIPGFLAQLDVAVLCSHSESMSNALLEYMAAGRAIVATNVGANSRLIRHEQEGLIVSSGDEAALGGAIRRFLHDPQLARGCALAARTRAASEFSRSAMVRRFEDFYAELTK